MTLAGDSIIVPQPRCKTVDLDHPSQDDFTAKSTFIANAQEQNLGWENCWQVSLVFILQIFINIFISSRELWMGELNSPL